MLVSRLRLVARIPRSIAPAGSSQSPTHLVGTYHRVTTGEEFMLFDGEDGDDAIYFPLPVHTAENQRLIPLWKVRGASIRDAKPSWVTRRLEYAQKHYTATN